MLKMTKEEVKCELNKLINNYIFRKMSRKKKCCVL